MATIKEVAQRAGVSVTTVSRVLNKRGYISQEMHDKIYATMEELNYQPNEVARSLTRRITKIIGLLVPSVDDPYFGEVVNQLILAAMRHGYKVMIYASDGQNDRALEYVGMLKANQVDGIIISLRSRELDALLDDNLPVVSFERIKVGRLPPRSERRKPQSGRWCRTRRPHPGTYRAPVWPIWNNRRAGCRSPWFQKCVLPAHAHA